MANWSNPTLSSAYTDVLGVLKDRDTDLALAFDGVSPTNLPTGTVRWNSSIGRWQKWTGTAWGELAATYALTAISSTSTISGQAFIPTAGGFPSNGMYLNSANVLGWNTNGITRMLLQESGLFLAATGGTAFLMTSRGSGSCGIGVQSYGGTSSPLATFGLYGFRGTDSAPSNLQNGDVVGEFNFFGRAGGSSSVAARIQAVLTAAPSGTFAPTDLVFLTGRTSSAATETLRLSNSGTVLAGGSTPNTATGAIHGATTARAHVRFNSNTLTIVNSFNVSSVALSPSNSSVYRVTFASALADRNFSAVATSSGIGAPGWTDLYTDGSATFEGASFVDVAVRDHTNTLVSRAVVNVVVFK